MLVFVLHFIVCLFLSSSCAPDVNYRPIIGVVTEDVYAPVAPPNVTSYLMASYVKYLEAGGARVVPIMIQKPVEYYKDLLSKINGVLIPGGGNILQSNGYGRTGKIIFELAMEMNNNGDYFPVWGTCLGFELLNFLVAKDNWMTSCAAEDLLANINFAEGFENSTMFKNLDSSVKKMMQTQNVTINYHQWCLTPKNYSISRLNEYFKILATNEDPRGLTFISIIEAHKYPFYGTAFHPEKVLFEWVYSDTHRNIPHSLEAVAVSQYFSRFFADEARKNMHHFPSKEAENAVLIYNYNPVYTGKKKQYEVEQTYYFS